MALATGSNTVAVLTGPEVVQVESEHTSTSDDLPAGKKDCTIQCNFEPKNKITATVSTRTDSVFFQAPPTSPKPITFHASTQMDENFSVDNYNISHDHSYCKHPVILPVIKEQMTKGPEGKHSLTDEDDTLSDSDDNDNINSDDDYHPIYDDSLSESEHEVEAETPVTEQKFIVFQSCLEKLMKYCP